MWLGVHTGQAPRRMLKKTKLGNENQYCEYLYDIKQASNFERMTAAKISGSLSYFRALNHFKNDGHFQFKMTDFVHEN